MTYYEKIQQMPLDEMSYFVLHQIKSDCRGCYDEDCEAEGYDNCLDCVVKMLNREVK